MTSVCRTSEYRTIIHFYAHFDPKVTLVNMLWMQGNSVCVLSDVTTGHPETAPKICKFGKVHWHCIICEISNLLIFCLVGMEIYEYINECNIIQIKTLGVVIPFNHGTGFIVAPSGDWLNTKQHVVPPGGKLFTFLVMQAIILVSFMLVKYLYQ